ENFWVELYHNSILINSSQNTNPDEYYSFDHKISQENRGIYDLVLTYKKITDIFPTFSYNLSLSFYPEYYIESYKYFSGIANASKIVSYKIINQSGLGYTSDLISGLESVLLNRTKYHIVSTCLSIATLGNDIETINYAINEISNSGILVVIAAGNSGVEGTEPLNKLALNRNAIVVGAINDKDQITSYSSMGKKIGGVFFKPDLVAPGGSKVQGSRSIISADVNSNNTTAAYGTSISAAIVSAAINILIDAKFDDWIQWEKYKPSKLIKAILLMTASETNLNREDDPLTDIDESIKNYSPSLFLGTFNNSLKDVHEGYGRINIDGAIDAITKFIKVNQIVNGTLTSSINNSIGPHVFARQISLTSNTQYLFNLTVNDDNSDFDIFLFSNETDEFGEPILLANSQNNEYLYDFPYDFFYYTPKRNRTYFLVVKAVKGTSDFSLNITSNIENNFQPQLNIPEINHINGIKNTTVMSRQEFEGNEPKKNSTLNSYRFYIEYTDNDRSNAPPMEVNVSIIQTSQNFTLTQAYPQSDNNFSEGVLYRSDYLQFNVPGIYTYYFTASDGTYDVRSGNFSITITILNEIQQFPYQHSFNEGLGNWTYTKSSWGMLFQNNTNDNRERLYSSNWTSLYFGTHHNYPNKYSYRPNPSLEYYLNGSLLSPIFNLTNLNDNMQPFAKFGLRISINKNDFVYLQINRINQSWTTWKTIKSYTNQEKEWFLENINLSQYKGSLIQFRINVSLDEKIDLTKNRGLIVDYVAIENFTNFNPPEIIFNLTTDISAKEISKYQKVMFTCDYYDLDNNYPDYVLIEAYTLINGHEKLMNFTMFNSYGDWNSSSIYLEDKGIQFRKSLLMGLVSNRTFRFHVSDGVYINSTEWFNKKNSIITIKDPNILEFNTYKDGKLIGYSFSNSHLEDYYIVHYVDDKLIPVENSAWIAGDTWHISEIYNKNLLHAGIGDLSADLDDSAGYGANWDANLITQPIQVNDEHNPYLEFNNNLSLQPEIPPYYYGTSPDICIISISVNFGKDWTVLKEYTYDIEGIEPKEQIDLSDYDDDIVMIKFTLRSNNIDTLSNLADGWLISDIYVGYDKTTDFQEPSIK
ncbi:MAG: S8 family serine peptidase, partial [Candidatus Hodarchaeota archaeon]